MKNPGIWTCQKIASSLYSRHGKNAAAELAKITTLSTTARRYIEGRILRSLEREAAAARVKP